MAFTTLLLFALFSIFNLGDSFTSYSASKEKLNHANLEKEQVSKLIDKSREGALRRKYIIDRAGVEQTENLRSIEIRGTATTPPEEGDTYYPGTEKFSVVEYE